MNWKSAVRWFLYLATPAGKRFKYAVLGVLSFLAFVITGAILGSNLIGYLSAVPALVFAVIYYASPTDEWKEANEQYKKELD